MFLSPFHICSTFITSGRPPALFYNTLSVIRSLYIDWGQFKYHQSKGRFFWLFHITIHLDSWWFCLIKNPWLFFSSTAVCFKPQTVKSEHGNSLKKGYSLQTESQALLADVFFWCFLMSSGAARPAFSELLPKEGWRSGILLTHTSKTSDWTPFKLLPPRDWNPFLSVTVFFA